MSVVTSETAVEVPSGWVRRIAGPVRYGLGLLGSVSLTFLDLTCITFIIGRVNPDRPGDRDRRREGYPQHLNGCSRSSASIRAGRAGRERPRRFPRKRSTSDPLNTLAAITALRPFPPVRC